MHRAVQSSDSAYDGLFVAVRSTRTFFLRRAVASGQTGEPIVLCHCCWRRERRVIGRASAAGRSTAAAGRPSGCRRARGGRRQAQSPLARLGITDARRRTDSGTAVFRQHYGMTFQEYSRRRAWDRHFENWGGRETRSRGLEQWLRSHSGFREAFGRTFGGPPGRQRDNGTISRRRFPARSGRRRRAATEEGICLLDSRRTSGGQVVAQRPLWAIGVPGNHPLLDRLRHELAAYFARRLPRIYGACGDAG